MRSPNQGLTELLEALCRMDPREHARKIIASMKERTGKTLEEWVAELKQTLPAEKKGRLKWLKERYGLGQSSAFLLLHHVENEGTTEAIRGDEESTPVDAQYQKENAPLKPVYDWLVGELQQLGEDVKVRPCKTYVPFYRNKVFVYVRPVKGKLHLALGLPEDTAHPRLEPVGRLGGPERIKVKAVAESKEDIVENLWPLIRKAYDLN